MWKSVFIIYYNQQDKANCSTFAENQSLSSGMRKRAESAFPWRCPVTTWAAAPKHVVRWLRMAQRTHVSALSFLRWQLMCDKENEPEQTTWEKNWARQTWGGGSSLRFQEDPYAGFISDVQLQRKFQLEQQHRFWWKQEKWSSCLIGTSLHINRLLHRVLKSAKWSYLTYCRYKHMNAERLGTPHSMVVKMCWWMSQSTLPDLLHNVKQIWSKFDVLWKIQNTKNLWNKLSLTAADVTLTSVRI